MIRRKKPPARLRLNGEEWETPWSQPVVNGVLVWRSAPGLTIAYHVMQNHLELIILRSHNNVMTRRTEMAIVTSYLSMQDTSIYCYR